MSAALALLDRDGLESLTMRHVAEHLRVSPMALYNHVADKRDLLQGVARCFLDRVNFPDDHPDWRQRIGACFRELRSACLAHPNAVRLLESIDDPPLSIFRPMEITLGALDEAAVSGEDAVRAYFLLLNFVLGQLSYEVRGPFRGLDPAEALRKRKFADAGFAHVARAVSTKQWDFGSAFEFGLSTILAGLSRSK